MDDYDKGRRNDSSNVSNWREFELGREHQKNLDAMGAGGLASEPTGPTITGESPILQFIVRIPFLLAGTLLYPVTLAVTLVVALLCVRLMPLVGADGSWQRLLAFIPALIVLWLCMRWDVRFGESHPTYRRARHVFRIGVFGVLGYEAARFFPGASARAVASPFSILHIGGAILGATLGFFMLRADGWRDFWYTTLAAFRMRVNSE